MIKYLVNYALFLRLTTLSLMVIFFILSVGVVTMYEDEILHHASKV